MKVKKHCAGSAFIFNLYLYRRVNNKLIYLKTMILIQIDKNVIIYNKGVVLNAY